MALTVMPATFGKCRFSATQFMETVTFSPRMSNSMISPLSLAKSAQRKACHLRLLGPAQNIVFRDFLSWIYVPSARVERRHNSAQQALCQAPDKLPQLQPCGIHNLTAHAIRRRSPVKRIVK